MLAVRAAADLDVLAVKPRITRIFSVSRSPCQSEGAGLCLMPERTRDVTLVEPGLRKAKIHVNHGLHRFFRIF